MYALELDRTELLTPDLARELEVEYHVSLEILANGEVRVSADMIDEIALFLHEESSYSDTDIRIAIEWAEV